MRILVLAAVAMMAVPGATALFEGYGAQVGDDAPAARVLSHDGPRDFFFIDTNGDNALNAGEEVFLARTATLAPGDVWLTDGGRLILGSDGVSGSQAASGAGSLSFLSEHGQSTFAPGDLLVLDAAGTDHGRLSGSDLVLSGENAGRFAAFVSVPLNAPLTSLQVPVGYVDDGDDGYDGEVLWVDTNHDGTPSPVDVRISGDRFGEVARAGQADVSLHLRDNEGPTTFAYIDEGGTNSYRPGDHLYMVRDISATTGAVRLVTTPAGAAGLHVRSGDTDAHPTRQILNGQLSVLGGDDHVDAGEYLVLDIHDLGQAGRLDASDVVLSGEHAGKTAAEAGIQSGADLRPVSPPRYVDLDGDRRFSLGDLAYYDADASGFVSPGDVQLATIEELVPEPEGTETTDPGPGDSETGGREPTETATQTREETDTATDADEAVPAMLPLLALLAVLCLRRR